MYPSPSISPGLPDADMMAVRVPVCHRGGTADDALDRSLHLAQLSAPTRTQLVQGEQLGLYLTLAPGVLQRHAWLRLPWGKRLVRSERLKRQQQQPQSGDELSESDIEQRELALDAAVLQRLHPCDLALRLALRSVSAAEAASHADHGGDTQGDIVHDPDQDEDESEKSATATPTAMPHSRSFSLAGMPTVSPTPSAPMSRSSSFAFRKSLPPNSGRNHHPARLAPGYAPHYPTPLRGQSTVDESQPAWAHLQADHHAAPGFGAEAVAPSSMHYFYTQEEGSTSPNASSTSPSTHAALTPGTLVLFIQTSLSVLPAYLSSASDHGQRKLLALEVELPSPPAHHHAALGVATLNLPNSGAFIIDANAGASGYSNLRSFVSSNRALQVPHALPPAREYVTVVDPLLVSSRAVCLGSEVGAAAEADVDDNDASSADGHAGFDIAVEFTLKNVTPHWTLMVHNLDFLLNRSRIFLKVAVPATPNTRPGSPTPNTATPFSQHFASSPQPAIRSSIHYIPLAQYFHNHAATASTDFPLRLAPHEQVNVLFFLTAPRRARLQALETALRACLTASGSPTASTFSLATSPLPFRTPFTIAFSIEGVASQSSRIVTQSKAVWRSQGVSAVDPLASPLTLASSLRLSLRIKVGSPVPLHREFPVFLTIVNHGSQATPPLQLVLLPTSHPIVQQAQKMQRADEQRLASSGPSANDFGRSLPPPPFSPSSPDPPLPLLFSPQTPFSPTTPFSFAVQPRDPHEPSPKAGEMHFPFRAVDATMTRRAGSMARSVSINTGEEPSSDSLAMTQISRSSTEVLTTTLAHFLADDQPSGTGETRAAAAAIQEEAIAAAEAADLQPANDGTISSLICLETSLPLGPIVAGGECSATLHFLALREGMLALDTLFVFDAASQAYFRPTHAATVFAVKQ